MDHGLKPCLLVAAPSLSCPYFNHTVVLLVDHREDGSLGFVVNRPADIDLDEILSQVGIEATVRSAVSPVMLGGPVAPETGWVVYDPTNFVPPEDEDGVLEVSDRLGVCANIAMLETMAKGEGPQQALMMLGYAGWGPGQLDEEIREGAWIVVDLDPSLVYDVPTDERWNAALAKLGIDPARIVGSTVADA